MLDVAAVRGLTSSHYACSYDEALSAKGPVVANPAVGNGEGVGCLSRGGTPVARRAGRGGGRWRLICTALTAERCDYARCSVIRSSSNFIAASPLPG